VSENKMLNTKFAVTGNKITFKNDIIQPPFTKFFCKFSSFLVGDNSWTSCYMFAIFISLFIIIGVVAFTGKDKRCKLSKQIINKIKIDIRSDRLTNKITKSCIYDIYRDEINMEERAFTKYFLP